jgi:hypothetical protein
MPCFANGGGIFRHIPPAHASKSLPKISTGGRPSHGDSGPAYEGFQRTQSGTEERFVNAVHVAIKFVRLPYFIPAGQVALAHLAVAE